MDRLARHAIITATLLTAMTLWTAAPADDDRAKTLPVGPPDVVFVPEGYQVSSTWRGKTDAGVPYPGSEITWLYDPDDPTRTALIGSSYHRGSPGKGEDMTGKFPTFQGATDATVTLEEDGDRLVLISEPPDQDDPYPYTFIESHGLTREEVLALASWTSWTENYWPLINGSLPEGMTELGVAPMPIPPHEAHRVEVIAPSGEQIRVSTLRAPPVLVEYYGAYYESEPIERRGQPGYRLSINRQIIDVWAEDGNVIALWLQRNETPPPDGIAETLIAKSASELDTLDTVD